MTHPDATSSGRYVMRRLDAPSSDSTSSDDLELDTTSSDDESDATSSGRYVTNDSKGRGGVNDSKGASDNCCNIM